MISLNPHNLWNEYHYTYFSDKENWGKAEEIKTQLANDEGPIQTQVLDSKAIMIRSLPT